MALNINFQGNIFDVDQNSIDVQYQAYSHSIGKWSNVRQSDQGQYNVNLGDGDLNTQDGTVLPGDKITVAFWDKGKERSGILSLFSALTFVYNGISNTVQNVQLLSDPPILCSWSSPRTVLIDTEFSVSLSPSLRREWEFYGKTMIQDSVVSGIPTFDFLKITKAEVDFELGVGNQTSHSYSKMGEKTMTAYFESSYGKTASCDMSIFAVYPQPIGSISITKNPLSILETANIEVELVDPNSVITSIDYYVDSTLSKTGAELSSTYQHVVNRVGSYRAYYVVSWNNGLMDLQFTVEDFIIVENTPPKIQVFHQKSQTLDYHHDFSVVVSDREDANSTLPVNWEVFFLNRRGDFPEPFFGCDETVSSSEEYYSILSTGSLGKDFTAPFAQVGDYRVVATTVDSGGLTDSSMVEFSVVNTCGEAENTCPNEYKTIEEYESAIAQARQEEIDKFNKVIADLRIEVEKNTVSHANRMNQDAIPTTIIPNAQRTELLNVGYEAPSDYPGQSINVGGGVNTLLPTQNQDDWID